MARMSYLQMRRVAGRHMYLGDITSAPLDYEKSHADSSDIRGWYKVQCPLRANHAIRASRVGQQRLFTDQPGLDHWKHVRISPSLSLAFQSPGR
jgi:hypothetical protein